MQVTDLKITGPNGTRLDLVAAALTARARTTVFGASTVRVDLPETMLDAQLLTANRLTAAGRDWKLVTISRIGELDVVRLVYEDAIVAALRAYTDPIMYSVALPASEIISRFCVEAGVQADIEESIGQIHIEGAGRSILEPTDSWREISALVDRLGGRVFSNGHRLVIARDATLLARDAGDIAPMRGAVRGDIDFHLDIAQPQERATFHVDDTWDFDAGDTVNLTASGPADGPWLVAEWQRDIPTTADTGRVRLTRPTTIGD